MFDEFDQNLCAVDGIVEPKPAVDELLGRTTVFLLTPARREELAELVLGDLAPVFWLGIAIVFVVAVDGFEPCGVDVVTLHNSVLREAINEVVGRRDVAGF